MTVLYMVGSAVVQWWNGSLESGANRTGFGYIRQLPLPHTKRGLRPIILRTSRRLRAVKSALYSMLMSALAPPELAARYEYFEDLVTAEDIFAYFLHSFDHCFL